VAVVAAVLIALGAVAGRWAGAEALRSQEVTPDLEGALNLHQRAVAAFWMHGAAELPAGGRCST
jgi:hypothetical protein